MRIVAGLWKGRKILVPDTPDTRPTMDRTREAVFNILRSASWAMSKNGSPLLAHATILDVFAGSGAMGLEALSQGATEVVFIESNKIATDVIRKNTEKLQAKTTIIQSDIERIPENKGKIATIAFLDPPYDQGLVSVALLRLLEKNWINADTLLVIETRKNEELMDIAILDTRLYGMAKMTFAHLSE